MKFKSSNSPTCQLCVSYVGARFALVMVMGIAIGGLATQFVKFPPSSAMVQTIAAQKTTQSDVENLKSRTTKLETDVRDIKDHINLP